MQKFRDSSNGKIKSKMQRLHRRLYHFGYTIVNTYVFHPKVYGILFNLFDFAFMIIFPLQTIWNQQKESNNVESTVTLNYILLLAKQPIFTYFVDFGNALVLLNFVLMVLSVAFFHNSKKYYLERQKECFIKLFKLIYNLVSRMWTAYLVCFQVLAIRCSFHEYACTATPNTGRLVVTFICLFLNFALLTFKHVYLNYYLPVQQATCSNPVTKYFLVNIVQCLFLMFLVAFQDFLKERVANFILLIPVLLIQTIQLYTHLRARTSFVRFVDTTNIVKDTALWIIDLFAIIIDGSNEPFDYALIFVAILCVMVVSASIYFMKQDKLKRLLNDFQSVRSQEQAEINLHSLVLMAIQKDPFDDMTLNLLLQQHHFTCTDSDCVCLRYDCKDKEVNVDLDKTHETNNALIKQNSIKTRLTTPLQKHEELLDIIMSTYKRNINSKRLNYLHVFLKAYYLNHIQTAYFELKKLRNKKKDKRMHEWLKVMILQKAHQQEASQNTKAFDIETTLQVDYCYEEYKRLIFETAMTVEQFWSNLAKQEYSMKEQINTGGRIVDGYMSIKKLYDKILKMKPEFKEAVRIFQHFNADVMNFENEASQAMNTFKNIHQKLRIARFNDYQARREKMGLLLVQCNPEKMKRIQHVNSQFTEQTGYKKSQLLNQDMNQLVPLQFQYVHDKLMERFMNVEHEKFLETATRRIWIKKCDGNITPMKIELQVCISAEKGIIIVCFFDPHQEYEFDKFSYSPQRGFLLLTDEFGHVIEATSNFLETFMLDQEINFIEDKVSIEDIFMNLGDYTDEELEKGVETQINQNFIFKQKNAHLSNHLLINVRLVIKCHKLPFNFTFKEVIFQTHEGENSQAFQSDVNINSKEFTKFGEQELRIEEEKGTESGSASYSSDSHNSLKLKQNMNFNQVPQTLINMRRSLLVYFVILLCTSMAILVVNMVSKDFYLTDQATVKQSILLFTQLSDMRLSFRIMQSKSRSWVSPYIDTDFYELQQVFADYHDHLSATQAQLLKSGFRKSQALQNLISNNDVTFQEIVGNNTVRYYNTSYELGIYSYITKSQQFISMTMEETQVAIANLQLQTPKDFYTQSEKDVYFIVLNGERSIRDTCFDISEQYVKDSQDRVSQFRMIVTVIIITCICVATIAAIFMIPVMFALDTEQHHIIGKWLKVKESTKATVIANISNFISHMQNEELEQTHHENAVPSDIDLDNSDYKADFSMWQTNKGISQLINPQQIVTQKAFVQDSGLNVDEIVLGNFEMTNIITVKHTVQQQFPSTRAEFLPQVSLGGMSSSRQLRNRLKSKKSTAKTMHAIESSQILEQNENDQSQAQLNPDSQHDKSVVQHLGQVFVKEEEDYSTKGEEMKDQLKSIYNRRKFSKVLVILSFTLLVNLFYIVAYLISNNLFDKFTSSYNHIRLINSRSTCLSESMVFLMETYLQNKTIYIHEQQQDSFDYVSGDCAQIETQFENLVTFLPASLRDLKEEKYEFESNRICDFVFASDPDLSAGCKTFNKGILLKGLRNSLQEIYHYIIKQYIQFQTLEGYKKDMIYLQTVLFNGDTTLENYFMMMYKYVTPIMNFYTVKIEKALINYFQHQLQLFIGVFSMFVLFLMATLILALNPLMNSLRRQVFRTKALLKIIPEQELHDIYQQYQKMMKMKEQQKYK